MKTWNEFLVERSGEFKYCCVLAEMPKQLFDEMYKFYQNLIEKKDLFLGEENDLGLEDEPHVTVLYGLHDDNFDDIKEFLQNEKPIQLTLKNKSCFNQENHDVLKFDVESDDLYKLNKKIKDNFKYTTSYNEYIPHCTIAYLKKGTAKKYLDNKEFNNTKVVIDELVFSSKDGSHRKFKLNG